MSLGVYGTQKLSDATFNDVDIFYAYSATREEIGNVELVPMFNNIADADFKKMIGADGLFKLRLPASIFNRVGFYSVLIKPKTFETTIQDCSFVVTSDDAQVQISKKGIVIPALQFRGQGELIGYQIEYFDKVNDVKIKNLHKIVTSSDLVSVSPNTNTVQGGAKNYILDENGSQLFLTVTPDESGLISNNTVDIGSQGQKILLSNTYFDPVFLDIEMTDQNIKTLSYALYGNNTRDLETGIFTIYDEENKVYKQYNLYTQKKQFQKGNVDIKEQRTNINLDQDFSQGSQGLIE